MKQYNFTFIFQESGENRPKIIVTCCHTVPDHCSMEDVGQALTVAFHECVKEGQQTKRTNAADVLTRAMARVDAKLGGSSFAVQADGVVQMDMRTGRIL